MVDRYTKVVLTTIACALAVLAVQNATHTAKADAPGLQKVQICDGEGRCARLVRTGEIDSVSLFGLSVVAVPVHH